MIKDQSSNSNLSNEVQIFQSEDGEISVDVRVENETVWLSLDQLSALFQRDRSVIAKHIKNIFKEEELYPQATLAKNAKVQIEGNRKVTREIEYYNLDLIISVGYRVNSKRGVQFRQWASKVLKEYLIKGYAINQNKLALEGIEEIRRSMELLSRTLNEDTDINDIGAAAVSLITEYARTWQLLLQYDEDRLIVPKGDENTSVPLHAIEAEKAITELKCKLSDIGEATELLGKEREGDNLKSILSNIEQTFGGKTLYPTLEMKAAHLLYFIIKDHPFVDGNKRVGCLLFLLYLKINDMKRKKLTDIALTALALLIAKSKPSEKELVIKLVTNFITK